MFAACFPVGTILDEIVAQNRSWKRPVFVLHDVRCWGDKPLEMMNFSSRLRELDHVVMGAYGGHLDRKKMPPMPLVKAKWKLQHEAPEVVDKICFEVDGQACYKESASRHHACSGLLLMLTGTGGMQLPSRVAVLDRDQLYLRCALRRGSDNLTIEALCGGSTARALDVSAQLDLGRLERARLLADLAPTTTATDATCRFDPFCGLWRCSVVVPTVAGAHDSSAALGLVSYLAQSLCRESVSKLLAPKGSRNATDSDGKEAQKRSKQKSKLRDERKKR